jgi:hypothetical protein
MNDLISRIPRAEYASWDSGRENHPTTCLEATRQEVLKEIERWRGDESPGSPHIFFLHGIAGIGKSTIAQTVAVAADNDATLGASFFFSRQGDSDLRDPKLLLPTLAYQLARSNPRFAQELCAELDGHVDVCRRNYQKQVEALFLLPLKRIPSADKPILIIVDAVDEATESEMRLLLPAFLGAVCATPAWVKLFVTGRPESHILAALQQEFNHRQIILHDIESSLVRRDINTYLAFELARLPGKLYLASSLPQDWFSSSELEQLVNRSGTLFIFASTLLRFLGDTDMNNPRLQLDVLLQPGSVPQDGAQPYAGLDQLYTDIISPRHGSGLNPKQASSNLRVVVGTLIVLQDTLPLQDMAHLLELPLHTIHSVLHKLHSVIILPQSDDQSPYIYHQSFTDFITSQQRCPEDYYVSTTYHHAQLAEACMKAIIQYAAAQPLENGTAHAPSLPAHLRYAVVYWASHLSQSGLGDTVLCTLVKELACTSLIAWMILASAIGQASTLAFSSQSAEHWMVRKMVSHATLKLINRPVD